MCTTGRVSARQPQWLSQGDAYSNSGRNRTLDLRLPQAPRLLVERSRWDREEYHRPDDRGEDVCRWTAWCFLLLLPRLRGPEESPLNLPHPGRSTRPEGPPV